MKIIHPDSILKGELTIASSKSESNRALMIHAYLGQKCELVNMSDSNDTRQLSKLLDEIDNASDDTAHTIDCADAGTVCRFLLSYLAQKKGTWLLTGTERLKQRPIAPLVEALRCMGADIHYSQQEGHLPIAIKGGELRPTDIEIDISESSQFASSLMMLLPSFHASVRMKLTGDPSSMPYVDMTIAMMNHFGAKVSREDNIIKVSPSEYIPKRFVVSPDWSSASYWLEAAALSRECHLVLKNFSDNTLQGDRVAVDVFRKLGVNCAFTAEGLEITKFKCADDDLSFDFLYNPDLFPAVSVACAALCDRVVLKGVRNLRYKESDRVDALITELSKIGAEYEVQSDIVIQKKGIDACKTPVFSTHNDHRIAMSLSMLALCLPSVVILEPDVVKKSYPGFWDDMYKLGFQDK